MDFKTIKYEKKDGLAVITLHRPEAMNSSNATSIAELNYVTKDIDQDDTVKSALITGGDKVFAAGGDIKFMSEASPLEMEAFIADCHAMHDRIAASPKPYVAAIAGLALGGGCELALACDIRIAAEGAVFGQPEINLAIIPGAGGTQRLTRVVGAGWARHLILTGEMIDVKTAFNIGLVTKVVPVEELQETALKYAKSLGKKSPNAIKSAKKCLQYSENTDMPSGLAYEQKAWAFLFCGEDQTEGMQAFLQKRKPVYRGK